MRASSGMPAGPIGSSAIAFRRARIGTAAAAGSVSITRIDPSTRVRIRNCSPVGSMCTSLAPVAIDQTDRRLHVARERRVEQAAIGRLDDRLAIHGPELRRARQVLAVVLFQ